MRTRTPTLLALLLSLMLSSPVARADRPVGWTPGELALLPNYCPDTQGFAHTRTGEHRSPRADYWVGLMGETFWSLHHYCWGLMNLRRAQQARLPPQARDHLIGTVIQDYHFVLRNADDGFVLLPEVLTRLGEAHLLLGQHGAANAAFLRARAVKPDYWPPYVAWANKQMEMGLTDGARETMTAALEHMPAEPRVQELAWRLGLSTVKSERTASSKMTRQGEAFGSSPHPAASAASQP